MKTHFFFSLVLSVGLYSCATKPESKKVEPAKQEPPKALTKENTVVESLESTFLRKDGKQNLLEELYEELSEKDEKLIALNQTRQLIYKNSNELLTEKVTYENHSTRYYESALHQIKTINDTVLQHQLLTKLSRSKQLLTQKLRSSNAYHVQIDANTALINDTHTSLKFLLTLALMEDYQKNNVPENEKFSTIIKQQQQFLQRLDSLLKTIKN